MQKIFHFQVICLTPGSKTKYPYRGSITANSENEVRAYIMRSYSNVVDIQIW